jgi:hypothetical protein
MGPTTESTTTPSQTRNRSVDAYRDALAWDQLEAVTAGEIKRLLINMPPRYAKSTCVSIMWPTWVWAREPFPGKPHNPVLEGRANQIARLRTYDCFRIVFIRIFRRQIQRSGDFLTRLT